MFQKLWQRTSQPLNYWKNEHVFTAKRKRENCFDHTSVVCSRRALICCGHVVVE